MPLKMTLSMQPVVVVVVVISSCLTNKQTVSLKLTLHLFWRRSSVWLTRNQVRELENEDDEDDENMTVDYNYMMMIFMNDGNDCCCRMALGSIHCYLATVLYLSIHLCMYPSIYHLSIHLCIHPSIYLSPPQVRRSYWRGKRKSGCF